MPDNSAKDSLEVSSKCSDKLIRWIDDPQRVKATVHFPDGIERQVAIRFETLFERLKKRNKSNESGPNL